VLGDGPAALVLFGESGIGESILWEAGVERGRTHVVAKQHVVEPFELDASELTAFWTEAMLVASILPDLFRPTKMNYEIHGNTIPHLHMHLYPRFHGDPMKEARPIDPRNAWDAETRSAPRRSLWEQALLMWR
jgi:diadenosine tetraphosphate (Ap4A) HIT family hydrolase